MANPLLAGRDPSLIRLITLAGAPWQDLSAPATWSPGADLSLLSAAELTSQGRWGWLLPNGASPPQDPYMHESVMPPQRQSSRWRGSHRSTERRAFGEQYQRA